MRVKGMDFRVSENRLCGNCKQPGRNGIDENQVAASWFVLSRLGPGFPRWWIASVEIGFAFVERGRGRGSPYKLADGKNNAEAVRS